MKRFVVRFALVLGLFATLVSSFYVQSISAEEFSLIRARVDFKPDTLPLLSFREWIACYIELPLGFRPSSIDVSSIVLNRTISAVRPVSIGDYDNDGIPDLCVTFNRAMVIRFILHNIGFTNRLVRSMTVTLTITGTIYDGTLFKGCDTIRLLLGSRPIPA